jgi:hypothetical protein
MRLRNLEFLDISLYFQEKNRRFPLFSYFDWLQASKCPVS